MLTIGFYLVMHGVQARDESKRGEAKVAKGCAELEEANPSSETVHTILQDICMVHGGILFHGGSFSLTDRWAKVSL
jgi:hypothetical protein